ncbi:MAG: hypothetical protein JWM14_3082 [Chitinophagaceae bacterium]|nr:hypothetical protein [Chitinophagaceae bacterium]
MNNIKTNTLFFALIALIFVAYGALSFMGPQDLIQWLVQSYGLDVEKGRLLPLYIHEMTWVKLKVTLIIILFFLLYLFYCDKDLVKEYRLSFSSFFSWIKKDLLAFSLKERIVLVTLVTVFGGVLVYYSSITPVQLDELHTWLFFIKRGPLVTAAYYPASNNHIAYNLLSIPWSIFLSPVWALRMVSLWSAVGTVILFVLILKRRYSFSWSVAGMLLLMSSACFAWYAVQGRGYVLELFFLITILYILVQSQWNFATDRLLVLLNALTMYCVPIAIIPIALLNGFYAYHVFRLDHRNLKRIIKTAVYTMVLIFLCYLPVFIFSGFGSLVNNPFVQRLTYDEAFVVGFTEYLPGIWTFISGTEGYFSFVVLILLLVTTLIICLPQNKFLWILLMALISPFILLQAYPVLLFERTWLWLVIPFVCWCIEVGCRFTQRRELYTRITAVIFIAVIMVVNIVRSYTTNQLLVKNAQRFLELKQAIDIRMAGKTIRVYNDVLYDYLLFYQKESKYELISGTQQSDIRTDALLKDWQDFKHSEGNVIWTDSVHVIYRTE